MKNLNQKQITVQLKPPKRRTTQNEKQKKSSKKGPKSLGKMLRVLGGLGGGAAGAYLGNPVVGGVVGTGLAGALSEWLGWGDYTVTSNSIVQRASANGMIPAMHKEGQTIIVRHREYLTEVKGSTAFAVQAQFPLNPGLATSFPWLSALASQYSEYRIRGMVFHYVPTSGTAVTGSNPALGSVMLQTSYRATEAAPTSKMELLNEYWASEAVPHQEFCHPIECDPKENPFNVQYVRMGEVPAGESQLMYDLGKTTLAVSGQQTTGGVLGDLWVTYEVELKKPVLTNANNTDITAFAGSSTSSVGVGNPLGATGTFSTSFNSFPGTFTITNNKITFPKGVTGAFQISCYYQGNTAFNGDDWTVTGGTLLPAVQSASSIASDYTTGTGMATSTCWVVISDPTVACTLTATLSTSTGAVAVRVIITETHPSAIVA